MAKSFEHQTLIFQGGGNGALASILDRESVGGGWELLQIVPGWFDTAGRFNLIGMTLVMRRPIPPGTAPKKHRHRTGGK